MDFLRQKVANVRSWLNPRVNQDSHILSKAAYDPEQYREELARRGYTHDKDLSNEDAQVYVKDNTAHVAYRGTSKLKDLAPDIQIALGKRKHRDFDEAITIAQKAKDKYGRAKAVGHSLGGTKALLASEKLNIPAEVYNPGTSPLYKQTIDNPDVTVYKNPFDIISSGITGKSVKHWFNPGRLFRPHKL